MQITAKHPTITARFKSEHAGISIYALPRLVDGLAVLVYVCWADGAVYSHRANEAEMTLILSELKAEKAFWAEEYSQRAEKSRTEGDELGEQHNRHYAQGFKERGERLHITTPPGSDVVMYVVELRRIDTGLPIVGQCISADSGSVQRRNLAEKLCKRHSDPRDCYVVEYAKETDSPAIQGAVIDKYELL